MKKMLIIAALALCALTAFADTAADLKAKLSAKFPNFGITNVRESEIKGLYQISVPGNILYSDGNYLVSGHIFNFDGEDITQAKVDEAVASMAAGLDKSFALKVGNGKKQVIEFSDPECPYCLKAELFFKNADVTRYIYFVPLSIHKDAERLSVDILCASDPQAEYKKVLDAVAAGGASTYKATSCAAGVEKLKKMVTVGEQFGVTGTPFFVIDGQTVSGANPVIMQMIQQ